MPVSLHHMEKVLLQIMNQKAKQQEGRKEKSRQQQERWRGEEKCDGKKWDRTRIKGNDVEKNPDSFNGLSKKICKGSKTNETKKAEPYKYI